MTFTHNIILVLFFGFTNTWAHSQVDIESNKFDASDHGGILLDDNDGYLAFVKNYQSDREKVRIQLYYSSFDINCNNYILFDFKHVIKALSPYLDIQTYPFGNSKIIDYNGKPDVICRHGPEECYTNKLHACAIDKLRHTTALVYNICLMDKDDQFLSDDESADWCGKSMNIDSEPIKECAKGTRGTELLLYYGEESKKANFSYVPHVLINGKICNTQNRVFKAYVCAAFTNPPPPCTNVINK